MKYVYLCLSALFLLGGCAVMDLSTQDTAIPLYPDKVEVSAYFGAGVDLDTAVRTGGEDDPQDENKVSIDGNYGCKLSLGMTPRVDLSGIFFLAAKSHGFKYGCKMLLYREGEHYLAAIPMLTSVRGKYERLNAFENTYAVYRANGGEAQLLYTYRAGKVVSFTGACRVNYSSFSKFYNGVNYGPYAVIHGGIRGNARFNLYAFHLTPELGLEYIPIVNGGSALKHLFSLGIGARL
ncbi:MAG: hypothetical protein Q8M98_00100 [Candidatus Cloacimonadaceae bacterium]|nr:hypothetical protein [Candidatus Cloacimonadaceae bacterium]